MDRPFEILTQFIIPTMCCLTLAACQNSPSVKEGDTTGPPAAEPAHVIEGVRVNGGSDYGPYILFNASSFRETENSKKLEKLVFYEAPEAPPANDDEPQIEDAVAGLYPLGWSKGDNFAYAVYSVAFHGAHVVNYELKDMGTGDILWRKEISYAMVKDTAELYSEMAADTVILINGAESDAELFKYAWMVSEKEVLPALEREGIIFNPSGAFLKQDYYKDNTFKVEKTAGEDPGDETEYTLKSNKLGPQVIYKDYFGREPEVAGVIKSPYNETIAVICRQKRTLFEMANEVVPIIVGYKLD